MEIHHPPSCRGLTAIFQISYVKSTAQRESLCRYKCVSELHLASHSVSLPSSPPRFSLPIIPPPHPGCQAMVCCHGDEWYSKGLKVCSGSCHLCSCRCCYHWYPTYHIWLLLPCTAGGDLCCHGYRYLGYM